MDIFRPTDIRAQPLTANRLRLLRPRRQSCRHRGWWSVWKLTARERVEHERT
jgi:hypothetical protein